MKSIGVVLIASIVALLLAEIAARVMRVPDERGNGSLLGVVLPPYAVVPPGQPRVTDRAQPYDDLVVDGSRITVGDIGGYHRFDAGLGYTHLENAISVNGWWQSNNIGARERAPTLDAVAPGITRWLLLGESFAHSSGLPNEQGWAYVVETSAPALEVVNLAVDGYGIAQAYLRYAALSRRLEHAGVMLMYVPNVDLWRDVNTLRTLGEPWSVQVIMPRFVVEGGSLRLVPSPYADPNDFVERNAASLDPTLEAHLRRYDRFYLPREYERTPLLHHLLTYEVTVAAYGRYRRGAIRRGLWEPGSEALQTARAIVQRLQDETATHGRSFVLLLLPNMNDLLRFQDEPDHKARWIRLVEFTCAGPWRCVDLAPPLQNIARDDLDTAADGRHFGPNVNRAIAAAVLEAIMRRAPPAPRQARGLPGQVRRCAPPCGDALRLAESPPRCDRRSA